MRLKFNIKNFKIIEIQTRFTSSRSSPKILLQYPLNLNFFSHKNRILLSFPSPYLPTNNNVPYYFHKKFIPLFWNHSFSRHRIISRITLDKDAKKRQLNTEEENPQQWFLSRELVKKKGYRLHQVCSIFLNDY